MGHRLLRRIATFSQALLTLIGPLIGMSARKILGRGTHRGVIFVRFVVVASTRARHCVALEEEKLNV